MLLDIPQTEWLAYPASQLQPWQFPRVGAVQRGLFFPWGEGRGAGIVINDPPLRRYGSMRPVEWWGTGGAERWFSDFPPVKSSTSELEPNCSMWVCPRGGLYLCEAGGQEFLAERLVRLQGYQHGRLSSHRAFRDTLLRNDWCLLHAGNVFLGQNNLWEYPEQVITLVNLHQVVSRTDWYPGFERRLWHLVKKSKG